MRGTAFLRLPSTIPAARSGTGSTSRGSMAVSAGPRSQGAYGDTKLGQPPARLLLSYSSDRGKTWAKPRMVSPSGAGDQFPWQSLAVNKDGHASDCMGTDTRDYTRWAGRRRHQSVRHGIRGRWRDVSAGGAALLRAIRRRGVQQKLGRYRGASAASRAETASIHFSGGSFDGGDYLGFTADTDGTFHAVWEDARTGVSEIWAARCASSAPRRRRLGCRQRAPTSWRRT